MKYLKSKLKKKLMNKKSILILIGVISIASVSIFLSSNFWIIYPCVGIENIITNVSIQGVFDHLKTEGTSNIGDFADVIGTADVSVVLRQDNHTIDEVEDIILSNLTEEEFRLRNRFTTFAGFSGIITCKGLRKLANNPRVERINGNYVIVGTEMTSLSIINVNCYENYVEVVFRNTGIGDLDTTEAIMTIVDISDNVVGVDDLGSSVIIKQDEFGNLTSTNFSLTRGVTYRIRIDVDGHAQTSECTTQAGGPQ